MSINLKHLVYSCDKSIDKLLIIDKFLSILLINSIITIKEYSLILDEFFPLIREIYGKDFFEEFFYKSFSTSFKEVMEEFNV